jgi:Fe-S cluster biogenesis protein NfuA
MTPLAMQIEPTGNDKVLKLTSNNILVRGSHHFRHIDETQEAPLVSKLFQFPFVKQVFVSANFIALERHDFVSWKEVQEEVLQFVEDFLDNGGKIIEEKKVGKNPVEIFAEQTPNPEVLKFVTNARLTERDLEFKGPDGIESSPLAQVLFQMPFVSEIFISDAYIAITKTPEVDWASIQTELRSFLREYLTAGKPVVSQQEKTVTEPARPQADDPVSKQIVSILDEYIRPAVAADGGNIAFESYDPKTKQVNVILQGACSGCPSSTITLKNGIEHILQQMIPGKIDEVVAINY